MTSLTTWKTVVLHLLHWCSQIPQTEAEWKQVAEDFWQQWDFPNCIGALDGKHVHIQPPPNSGSTDFNHKDFNSIVLLALNISVCRQWQLWLNF